MISLNIITLVTSLVIIMLCSAVLYVFLVAYVLPRFCMKPSYDLPVICERGIKKYLFGNGRAIVFEPSTLSKRYIKQYILSRNDEEKYIKCKIDERVYSIKYDVIAYNSADKVIAIVQQSELIVDPGVTKSALLPPDTSYVSVIVKEVNGKKVTSETALQLPMSHVIKYAALAVVCSLAQGSLFYVLINKCVDLVLPHFRGMELLGYLGALPIFAILGVIISVVCVLCYRSREVRIRK